MKQILVMMMALVLVGCGEDESAPNPTALSPTKTSVEAKKPQPPKTNPEKLIADPIVEKAIRMSIKKPEGELSEADLEKVKRLPTQFLVGNEITDVCLKDLAKLQKLTVLELGFTKITDAGLKELANMQQLTELVLYGAKITAADIAELEKALPKCQIFHDYE